MRYVFIADDLEQPLNHFSNYKTFLTLNIRKNTE